jgi:hypothetical protein
MPDISSLASRIDADFAAVAGKVKQSQVEQPALHTRGDR